MCRPHFAAFFGHGSRSNRHSLGYVLKYVVQSSSLRTIRLHRLNFHVVLRKLIAELQAFSQRIEKAAMVRFYCSIHADDKMLIRQMRCDSAFHGIPHANRCRTSNERPNDLGSVPTAYSVDQKFALFGARP